MSPRKNEEPVEAEIVNDKDERVYSTKRDGKFYFGLILIVIGGSFILENLYPNLHIWRNFWPVILIAFGLSLIAKGTQE